MSDDGFVSTYLQNRYQIDEYLEEKEDDNKFQRDNITDLVFEVLEVVLKPNSLSEREQYYIELYDSVEHGYNKRNEVNASGDT